MRHTIEHWDKWLFQKINADWTFTTLDPVMLLLRNPLAWIPLYIFVLAWAYFKMPAYWKLLLLLTLFTFGITDFCNSSLLKPFFGRLRPCHDPSLASVIRSLVGCGGRYSMPSSHAANHFGLATCWFITVRHFTGKKWYWVWPWAATIGYAQVYVGKHFPLDILAGALVGIATGLLSAVILRYCRRQSTTA